MTPAIPAWTPLPARIRAARINDFMQWLDSARGLRFDSYDALWQWSVTDIDAFWRATWDWFAVASPTPPTRALGSAAMPGAEWFPGVSLNYVRQVFRHVTDARPAIVARDETGVTTELSWHELQRQVAALGHTLRRLGIGPGDRVVAYLPNILRRRRRLFRRLPEAGGGAGAGGRSPGVACGRLDRFAARARELRVDTRPRRP